MNTETATLKTERKQTRNAATQLFVLYRTRQESSKTDLIGFDFKSDMDVWLSNNDVEVMRIVRGVEKKIRSTNKVTLL